VNGVARIGVIGVIGDTTRRRSTSY